MLDYSARFDAVRDIPARFGAVRDIPARLLEAYTFTREAAGGVHLYPRGWQ